MSLFKTRVLPLLLAAVLCLSALPRTASADACYTGMLEWLTQDALLGEPGESAASQDYGLTLLAVYAYSGTVILTGKDDQDSARRLVWNGLTADDCYAVFIAACSAYDWFSSLAPDSPPVLALALSEAEDDLILIDNSADAESLTMEFVVRDGEAVGVE